MLVLAFAWLVYSVLTLIYISCQNLVISRHWERDATANSGGWLMSSFIDQVIPAEGALWSCFFVSSIDNGKHFRQLLKFLFTT